MRNDKFFSLKLSDRLEEDRVTVPNFSPKKNIIERISRILFAPGKNPVDHVNKKPALLGALQIGPVLFLMLVSFSFLLFI
jgi:hypothetical protein